MKMSKEDIEKRPRIVLIVRGILENDKGELLLIKRSDKDSWKPGFWEFPGGKLDPGQDVYIAFEREVLEETGLSVKPIKPLFFVDSYINPRYKYPGLPFVMIIGKGIVSGGKITLSDDHSDFKWLKPEEALKLDITPETKKALPVFYS